MCGIAGRVGPFSAADATLVERMRDSLAHRGPDDVGLWSRAFPLADLDFRVTLGHRRLAIIDPSPAGRQPMLSRDGLAVACNNGEIYNFRELRRELERLGIEFSTEADTEVLVEGFRAWGLDLLPRLHGMFAFALWDEPGKRLLLVRDRMGIKPLYYSQIGEQLIFASELQALRRTPGFPEQISREALSHFLAYGYIGGPQTIYSAAHRLMPGEYLEWKRGKITRASWWSLLESSSLVQPPTDAESIVDTLEELLRDAVTERLVSDVPVGAFLSGGIDSSAVVSVMSELSPDPVQTFTVGFEQETFDESSAARLVARHLGTDHHEIRVSRRQALEVAHQLPHLYDEPFADASAIPTVLVSRFARERVKVVLSGDGGDELFGGYSRYRRIARFDRLAGIPAALRRPLARLGARAVSPSRRQRFRLLAEDGTVDFAEKITSRFSDRSVYECTGASPRFGREIFRDHFLGAPSRSAARRAMFADAATSLVDDILTKLDRASMSIALEARVPLLDHRLVGFALSLPVHSLWDGAITKLPLRQLASRRVPPHLLERPKSGFGFPLQGLLATELDEWTSHYLDPARLSEEGLLDPTSVSRMLKTTSRADRTAIRGLWNLISFERWFAARERGEEIT